MHIYISSLIQSSPSEDQSFLRGRKYSAVHYCCTFDMCIYIYIHTHIYICKYTSYIYRYISKKNIYIYTRIKVGADTYVYICTHVYRGVEYIYIIGEKLKINGIVIHKKYIKFDK